MHPAALDPDTLLAECDLERLRRSGPGGQRRNKVETGVRLRHRPSGLHSEATECRSSEQNLHAAILRLRFALAVGVRHTPLPAPTSRWRQRIQRRRLSVNLEHADIPALLAEALDCLAADDWNLSAVGERLEISATQLVKLLSADARALQQLNDHRQQRGLRRLSPG